MRSWVLSVMSTDVMWQDLTQHDWCSAECVFCHCGVNALCSSRRGTAKETRTFQIRTVHFAHGQMQLDAWHTHSMPNNQNGCFPECTVSYTGMGLDPISFSIHGSEKSGSLLTTQWLCWNSEDLQEPQLCGTRAVLRRASRWGWMGEVDRSNLCSAQNIGLDLK